jgi:hypothetical protein
MGNGRLRDAKHGQRVYLRGTWIARVVVMGHGMRAMLPVVCDYP